MIYTQKMRSAISQLRSPHDFVVDIVEYDMNPRFIGLRFYENQWAHYTDGERLKCLNHLQKIKNIIEAYGVPVTLEPVIDTGRTLPEKYRRTFNE